MARRRTNKSFAEELPVLLDQRSLSLRALAREVGVGDDHLSRILRGVRAKRASGELARRVALALDLPEDYFPESRSAFVVEHIDNHPAVRDRVYDQLRRLEQKS